MPYSKISELPKNVKGLPEEGQKMWMSVFNSAYSGTCKDSPDKDACAAKVAWSQVSKKYGKKESSLTEFSLSVYAATHNKPAGTLRWKASASDVFNDLLLDNMTAELFDNFMDRIDANELAPEEFRSDAWQGGMPYLSVAHYDDLNGDGIPGDVEKIYIDGNYLKACGEFKKTPLGLACYHSLCKDLYEEEKSETKEPIRISIAFLDWKHRHKDDGTVFERKSLDDICTKCLMEMITGEYSGKEYLKGQLVHLALTRSPVNKRTSISLEVEKSMATQKEDAVSIVGEELADELENKKSELVGKSQALVEMSKTDTEDVTEEVTEEVVEEKVEVPAKEDKAEALRKEDKVDLSEVMSSISELKELLQTESKHEEKEPHPMEEPFATFRASYDEILSSNLSVDDKLRALQEPLDIISRAIVDSVKDKGTGTVEPVGDVQAIAKALSDVMSPISSKLDLLLDQRSRTEKSDNYIPEQRSISANEAIKRTTQVPSSVSQSATPRIRELVERSVGLIG
jgi:cation transport regulator ChaB